MAVSIKNKGVINPVEIDENNMIITGEMRWRASKVAGLKTVPCKVLKIDDKERFLRQMHENIHHASMNGWDVAKGLERSGKILVEPGSMKTRPKVIEPLSREFGKSQRWISEHFQILKETKEIQKLVQTEAVDYTRLRHYRQIPDEHKEWAKKTILQDRTLSRDAVKYIASKMGQAQGDNRPDIIKKIKETSWSGKTIFQTVVVLDKIYPPERQKIEDAQKVAEMIQTKIIELTELLEMYPLVFFGKIGNVSIAPFLLREVKVIGEYLANKPIQGNFKLKEGKKNGKM